MCTNDDGSSSKGVKDGQSAHLASSRTHTHLETGNGHENEEIAELKGQIDQLLLVRHAYNECMYAYMCVCVSYTYTYVAMHVFICVSVCIYVYTYATAVVEKVCMGCTYI